jgi:hypothetical protein
MSSVPFYSSDTLSLSRDRVKHSVNSSINFFLSCINFAHWVVRFIVFALAAAAAMSSSAPFVTTGSTPLCDSCHEHYSERHCQDCGEHLCTWCNLDKHEPIGKRNHHRPRHYGVDPHAQLEAPARASADEAVAQANRRGSGKASAAGGSSTNEESANTDSEAKYSFDPSTSRIHLTTETFLPLSPEEAWELLGEWECPFLPYAVEISGQPGLAGEKRVLNVPREDGSGEDQITERLIQRSERSLFYSYSRVDNPAASYTDFTSKFSFLPVLTAGSSGSKRTVLQWSTSVQPRDASQHQAVAEEVANFQNSWKRFFEAAINLEE